MFIDWLICVERAGLPTYDMENSSLTEEGFLLTEVKAEVKYEVPDLHTVFRKKAILKPAWTDLNEICDCCSLEAVD